MPRQKRPKLKRRADGRFRLRYDGQEFYSTPWAADERECYAQRDAYIRRKESGEFQPENIRFAEYGAKWLQAYKAHLTNGPYNTHVRMLNRFADSIENKYIREVTPSDVSRFYQQFSGMSASTIHSARDTIKGVFKAAFADGIIKKDPAAAVDPPKGTKGTHREISDEERALIHQTAHRLRPAVLVMLYAGLRRGEAMALNIQRDVDFRRMIITVREAVRFDDQGRPMIVRPKTAAGVREVPMLEGLARELETIIGLLCPSASGGLMTESAWSRAWDSYLYALGEKKNGCSRRWAKSAWVPVVIRAHDLRHSFCTMLYDSGVDLKTAMLWMGHADQTMTMQIYTHLTETRRKEAENALRSAQKASFGGQIGGQIPESALKPL